MPEILRLPNISASLGIMCIKDYRNVVSCSGLQMKLKQISFSEPYSMLYC